MSGVTVGTRLERLLDLERAVKVQIQLEEQHVARGGTAREGFAYPVILHTAPPSAPNVATSKVRAWAIANGYLAPHQRHGRVPREIFDLYHEAAS